MSHFVDACAPRMDSNPLYLENDRIIYRVICPQLERDHPLSHD